jgi:2'-hydroxyisoflavone reductase
VIGSTAGRYRGLVRILIIGGTSFLGRHVTQQALDEGNTVTLFNRGRTNPQAFPDAELIQGDRNGDLTSVAGRKWEATVDVCGFVPRQVRSLLEVLGEGAGLYCFISSISAYPESVAAGFDETAPILSPSYDDELTMEKYGELKVGCELTARELVGDERLSVVRPGYIVGPYDPTNRFAYWVERVAAGGRILGPAADQPVQVIDGRDLASFVVALVDHQTAGVFHTVAPDPPFSFAEFLAQIANGIGVPTPDVDWRSANDLLPLSDAGEGWAMMAANVDKARAHGLSWRPLADTARDTLAWVQAAREAGTYRGRPEAAMSPEQEAAILAGS